MSHRIFNFSAGPAMLPTEVLEKSARRWSIIRARASASPRCSHRGKEFDARPRRGDRPVQEARSASATRTTSCSCRAARRSSSRIIPMNFLHTPADYLVGGEWSKKAAGVGKETRQDQRRRHQRSEQFRSFAAAKRMEAARPTPTTSTSARTRPCTAIACRAWPKHPNLIVDASSEFMSRPHPVERLRWSTAARRRTSARPAWCWRSSARTCTRSRRRRRASSGASRIRPRPSSMINTPPTFGVYILLEIFRWLEAQGGLAAMEKRNADEGEADLRRHRQPQRLLQGHRPRQGAALSHMNVTYRLPSEELTDEFVKTAAKNGMVGLKGYRTVGGIRASIYNAMPVEGCQGAGELHEGFRVEEVVTKHTTRAPIDVARPACPAVLFLRRGLIRIRLGCRASEKACAPPPRRRTALALSETRFRPPVPSSLPSRRREVSRHGTRMSRHRTHLPRRRTHLPRHRTHLTRRRTH